MCKSILRNVAEKMTLVYFSRRRVHGLGKLERVFRHVCQWHAQPAPHVLRTVLRRRQLHWKLQRNGGVRRCQLSRYIQCQNRGEHFISLIVLKRTNGNQNLPLKSFDYIHNINITLTTLSFLYMYELANLLVSQKLI